MADLVSSDQSVGESLLEAGWNQGTLFELPGASHFWNGNSEQGSEKLVEVKAREIRSSERLILISQACDILSSDEQYVEALLVRIKDKPSDRKYLARILNSYRQFVLDPDRGLVADARVRLQIAKLTLNHAQPDSWFMTEQTREDFVDWLAGRFDRPPVPQPIFEALCRPVRDVLERMRDEDPKAFAALDRSARRIRIRLPPSESSNLDLGLVLVIQDELDEVGADAVESFVDTIAYSVASNDQTYILRIERIPYGAMLLQEFEATRPIDLDYMTDQGDEMTLPPTGVDSF